MHTLTLPATHPHTHPPRPARPHHLQLLRWAQRYECEKTDEAFLVKATLGVGFHQPRIADLNSSLWGFLNASISGEAETLFNGADALQGIGAWRRIIAYIDHGKIIKFKAGLENPAPSHKSVMGSSGITSKLEVADDISNSGECELGLAAARQFVVVR